MVALRALLRVFSYLFHGLLILFLLGLSAVALSSGQALHLDMLPWHGQSLTFWLLFSGLLGLLSLVLALRRWRLLFVLWTLAVLVVMVRGFFLGPYEFSGRHEFYDALLLSLGALIAACGAVLPRRRALTR